MNLHQGFLNKGRSVRIPINKLKQFHRTKHHRNENNEIIPFSFVIAGHSNICQQFFIAKKAKENFGVQ